MSSHSKGQLILDLMKAYRILKEADELGIWSEKHDMFVERAGDKLKKLEELGVPTWISGKFFLMGWGENPRVRQLAMEYTND